jgi:hypothetical protein
MEILREKTQSTESTSTRDKPRATDVDVGGSEEEEEEDDDGNDDDDNDDDDEEEEEEEEEEAEDEEEVDAKAKENVDKKEERKRLDPGKGSKPEKNGSPSIATGPVTDL